MSVLNLRFIKRKYKGSQERIVELSSQMDCVGCICSFMFLLCLHS